MPNKLQKERSKTTAMMIDEREKLLPLFKVVGKKRTSKAKLSLISLLMIRG
jgi:hypothetical protein